MTDFPLQKMTSLTDLKRSLIERGYGLEKAWASPEHLRRLEQEIERLMGICSNESQDPDASKSRQATDPRPLCVNERSSPSTICRMEFLAGASPMVADFVENVLTPFLQRAVGERLNLLKDKCNLKPAGGEGFGPHQDVTAYKHFGAVSHLTAALHLSDATHTNGCMEFADPEGVKGHKIETWLGPRREGKTVRGGRHHGEILPSEADLWDWQSVPAKAGDLLLFDSFVPHRSGANESDLKRSILFFTYIVSDQATMTYSDYYREKFQRPDNPIFHVATPTLHEESQGT